MDQDIRRRIVYGLISLALTSLAAWLAVKLTNMILGEPEKNQLAG
jgi:hypothetical protein